MRRELGSALFAAIVSIGLASAASARSGDGFCGGLRDRGRGPLLTLLGLTDDGRLVRFRECFPQRVKSIAPITGLGGADAALVGIDFRVKDGKLYGVGSGGGVYEIDPATGVATLRSQLTETLVGASFGVDFNPAADRLRIVSDAGQNLRHNVDQGGTTIADLGLKNGDAAAAGVTGAGYTNNDLAADTATTLFDVDTALDQLSIQSPPNNGSLVPTGKLGVDAGAAVGFDVYSNVRGGVAVANWGFASLPVGGATGLYRIELTTGRAIPIGTLGDAIVDVAIPLDQ